MGETDDFEWDDAKAAANLATHNVLLGLSTLTFDGRIRVDGPSTKPHDDEPRFETVAEIRRAPPKEAVE